MIESRAGRKVFTIARASLLRYLPTLAALAVFVFYLPAGFHPWWSACSHSHARRRHVLVIQLGLYNFTVADVDCTTRRAIHALAKRLGRALPAALR